MHYKGTGPRGPGAGGVPVQADRELLLQGDSTIIAVPSGQPVTLLDVIWNAPGPEGLTLRFRFLAPQIAREGGMVDVDTAIADIQHLCESYALPRLADFGAPPAQVVISLSDRDVPFGETVPEATQYFEAFAIEDGTCVWQVY